MPSKSPSGSQKKKTSSKKPTAEPIPISKGNEAGNGASSESRSAVLSHPEIQEKIRQRAYELYVERGRREGYHDEDWARAEAEVLSGHRKEEKSA